MKVGFLGERGTCCLSLNIHGINILLDCSASPRLAPASPHLSAQQPGTDAQQQQAPAPANRLAIQLRVPQLHEVVRTQALHAVLVTSPHALLGLPHLQQLLQQEGRKLPLHVYCTEPVYHAFEHLATELLETHQQLLQQQQPEQRSQQQQASQIAANQLHLLQLQMQQHVLQLFAQQRQQQQQPFQHGWRPPAPLYGFTPAAAAAVVRPPVPPPQPPPLPVAAATAASAASAATGRLMGVSVPSAPVPHAARAVPGPKPPPMPPPLNPAAISYRQLLQPHPAAAAAAVPPPRPPPMPPPPATGAPAAATGLLRAPMPTVSADSGFASVEVSAGFGALAVPPPRPPTAPPPPAAPAYVPAVPAPAEPAAAAIGGTTVQPPIPPPVPPPGSPTAAAAETGDVSDLRSGSAAAETLDQPKTCLVPMFTANDLQSVLDQLQIVRFGERVVLPGCWGVTAESRPSGSSTVGSCMWIIRMGSQRIAYLSPASLYPNHSAPLHKPSLQALDALVLGPGSLCPDLITPGASSATDLEAVLFSGYADDMLRMAASAAAHAVRAGGRVLVPVLPSGGVCQFLEHIPAALQELVPNSSHTPVFYLSPVAKDTLATVNSCCEYLEPARRDLVLSTGTAPFKFDGYVTNGRITLLTGAGSGVEGQQQQQWAADVAKVAGAGPCVAFVSLWSLAAGPGATLADLWSRNPNNLLLLTEQGPQTADWLQGCSLIWQQQQQQQRWQIQYCPISSTAGLTPTAVPLAVPASIGPVPASKTAAPAGLAGHSSCKVAAACRTAAEGCLTAGQLVGLLRPHGSAVRAGSGSGSSSTVQQLILGLQDHTLLLQAFKNFRSSLDGCKISPLLTTISPPAPPQPHTTITTTTATPTSRATSSLNFQLINLPESLLHVLLSKKLAETLVLTPVPQKVLEVTLPQGSHTASGIGLATSQLTHAGGHGVGGSYQSPAAAAAAAAAGSAAAVVGASAVVVVPNTHATYLPTDTRALPSAQRHISDSVMDSLGQSGKSKDLDPDLDPAIQTSVARVQGSLRYQSGVWRLEPLAGDEQFEGVAAAAAAAAGGEAQQTEALMWGSVDVGALLDDLQAAGCTSLYLNSENATLNDGSEAPVTVITIPEVDAELRLSEGESEVICDDQRVRKKLTDVLMKQLQYL